MNPKIKICGLKYPGNIRDVIALQPDYIGFICYPRSRRFIDGLDANWVTELQGPKKTGVFVDASVQDVREALGKYGFQAVQLHGSESAAYCAELADTGVEIIKAFGINEDFDWSVTAEYEPVTDYFLFDTRSSQHGGSGKQFNWSLLAGYTGNTPYFLSGGIGAENIADALQLNDNRLYALDLNSKFETEPGVKDITLLSNTLQTIDDE